MNSARAPPAYNETKESYRPEIIDKEIEDAQDDHQHHRTPLCLETHHNHHTSHESEQTNDHSRNTPITSENKPDEQEDQQDPPGKLDVHFAVFLVYRRQPRWGKPFAHPGVAENHEKPTHNAEIAEKEVQVKYKTVAESLGNDHTKEAEYSPIGVLADDDKGRTYKHGDDVDGEEEMREAPWDYESSLLAEELTPYKNVQTRKM